MNKTHSYSHSREPEGPFENTDMNNIRNGNLDSKLSQTINLIEQLDDEMRTNLSIKQGYSEIKILTSLVRNHLLGKMTTRSVLSASSGLSYGTSFRAIEDLVERGLISKRSRSVTGKSFSLHPTPKLLAEWEILSRRLYSLINTSFLLSNEHNYEKLQGYFYGASYYEGDVINTHITLDHRLFMAGQLRILAHADPCFMAMGKLKRQLEVIFGASIKIRALSIDKLRDEIIANAKRKHSKYDLIACDFPWFGELAEKKCLMNLDSLIQSSALKMEDFHESALATSRYQGKQYGLPILSTPELLFVRQDMLDKHDLPLPKTTDDLLQTAKKLHKPHQEVSGIAWNAAKGTPLGHSFLYMMASFGGAVINLSTSVSGFDAENVSGENYRPQFDSDAAKQAAEYLKELITYSPDTILSMSWYERTRCYAEGHAAMVYSTTLLAPMIEGNKDSPAYKNTIYLPLPHGAAGKNLAPIGGYGLAIPANIEQERIHSIWTILQLLVSPQASKLYIENGSFVSSCYAVGNDPQVKEITLLPSYVNKLSRSGELQMWPRPPIAEITQIINMVGVEAHDMLRGVTTIKQGLNKLQNDVDKLMRAHHHY
ncbi:MAG: extracellular solute-binding protein [Alphaproteobacteria bacterium]|nr:extracellular solute-binding protein [Alphaproteobacteria bacterium]